MKMTHCQNALTEYRENDKEEKRKKKRSHIHKIIGHIFKADSRQFHFSQSQNL